jgi:hypothetical protein
MLIVWHVSKNSIDFSNLLEHTNKGDSRHVIALVQKASGYFVGQLIAVFWIRGQGRPCLIGTFRSAKGVVFQPGEDIDNKIIS